MSENDQIVAGVRCFVCGHETRQVGFTDADARRYVTEAKQHEMSHIGPGGRLAVPVCTCRQLAQVIDSVAPQALAERDPFCPEHGELEVPC